MTHIALLTRAPHSEAEVVVELLRANGIPAVASEAHGWYTMFSGDRRTETRIEVPAESLEEARRILAAAREAGAALEEDS